MKKGSISRKEPESREILPGYEAYPSSDDIYRKEKEEDIDPEDISEKKDSFQKRKLFQKDSGQGSDDDLDIPGSELDDDMENIGSEDEENNYYSFGDDYSDVDEDTE